MGGDRDGAGIARAVALVGVRGGGSFTWFGETLRPVPPRVAAQLDGDTMRAVLVDAIAGCLYANFYCPGQAQPRRPAFIAPAGAGGDLEHALDAANQGTGSWEPDWTLRGGWDGGSARVRRAGDGLEVLVGRDEWRPQSADRGLVRMPKGLFRVSPGYYTALGDRALSFDRPVTRVYFNVSAEGAVACVRLLTTRLNAAGIPFRLKAVNVRGPAYDRADSLVVYLAGDQSDGWRTIILEAAGQLAPQLGSATPSMTRPVSRGVATAADPGDGQSFGMHRCGLLAEGIVLAWERRSPAIDAVRETWAAAGVDVSAPYGRRDLAGWI